MAGLQTQHWQKWEVAGLEVDFRGSICRTGWQIGYTEWKRGREGGSSGTHASRGTVVSCTEMQRQDEQVWWEQ